HRERADFVFLRIAGGLALDLVARTSGADARIAGGQVAGVGIAALDHEVRDDAVELHAIVETTVGQLLEVGDGVGGFFLVQVGDDGAPVRLESCGLWHDREPKGAGERVGGAYFFRAGALAMKWKTRATLQPASSAGEKVHRPMT